jgi:hypothetical protein
MPFTEIILVYTENNAKAINKNMDLLVVKAAGAYSYRSALMG